MLPPVSDTPMSTPDARRSPIRNSLLWREASFASVGAALGIWLLAELSLRLEVLLLIAPFGATCVLLFAIPHVPLAQPRNVIGGHLVSAAIGLAALALLGPGPLAMALGVGLAIGAMVMTRTLHPPAGADPLVVIATGASWNFLLLPVLAGSVGLVLLAVAYHRFVSRRPYPAKP